MKNILLSFDIEEFDVPVEYGRNISIDEQINISTKGLIEILKILDKSDIKATFYSTVIFAQKNKDLLKKMIDNGHEIASHSYYHGKYKSEDLLKSKIELEAICENKIWGFRKPQLQPVDENLLRECGYIYNSSINPTFIPKRYNHLRHERTYMVKDNLFIFPVSVSPVFRIPLFWLSFHNFPTFIYNKLCDFTIKKDDYLHLYFHPWEFTDLTDKAFNLPSYISRNSGQKMISRFENFINIMMSKGYKFTTTLNFIKLKSPLIIEK